MIGAIYILVNADLETIDNVAEEDRYFDKAEGEQFYQLAMSSIKSLKKHMPDLPVTLFTNVTIREDHLFDDVVYIEPRDMWISKYDAMIRTPYERTVHIDCDTFICDDFTEIFTLLDKFDLALPLSLHYVSRYSHYAPPAFTEPAGGIIVWKNTEKMRSVWRDVLKLMEIRGRGSDEPGLRKVLYEREDVRFAVLPPEYNCPQAHPCYLFDKVKILHCKGEKAEEDAEIINKVFEENKRPYKRLLTGKKVLYLRHLKQKVMTVAEEAEYHGGRPGTRRVI